MCGYRDEVLVSWTGQEALGGMDVRSERCADCQRRIEVRPTLEVYTTDEGPHAC
jgi:hypothetical protein